MSPFEKVIAFCVAWMVVSCAAVIVLSRILGANRRDDGEEGRDA